MNTNDNFDRALAEWLRVDSEHRVPDHLDAVLHETRVRRQRPAWLSVERWLPLPTTLGTGLRPRLVWLLIVVGLILGVAGTILLIAGSRPRLPQPFGPAANGSVAYGASDGDIYVLDPATGSSRLLVSGPTKDETPSFSRDGSTFVFARESETPGLWRLMLANADGTNVRPLTKPIYPTLNEWSPDGTQMVVVDASATTGRLFLYNIDGSPPQLLNIGDLEPSSVAFRPSGDALVFRGWRAGLHGVYTVRTDGSGLRPILPPTSADLAWQEPALTPDGTTVAYTSWGAGIGSIRLLDIDGGQDRAVVLEGPTTTDSWPQWSPDGTLLVFQRYFGGSFRLAVARASGGSVTETGPRIREGTGGAVIGFSPDGSQIIVRVDADGSTWILDIHGGPGTHLAIDNTQAATWQRVTP